MEWGLGIYRILCKIKRVDTSNFIAKKFLEFRACALQNRMTKKKVENVLPRNNCNTWCVDLCMHWCKKCHFTWESLCA